MAIKAASSKVIFLCTQMEAGGVQVRATSMCEALNALGYNIDVVFMYKKRSPFPENARHHVMLATPPKGPMDHIRAIIRTIGYIRKERPQAIVGFAHFSSPIAAIAGLISKTPIRVGTQTNPPSTVPFVGRMLDLLCGFFGIYTSNIAVSNTVYKDFLKYPKSYLSKTKIIHNGASFTPTELSKNECRDYFGLNNDENLLISCGRLSAQKNHEFAIDILRDLPNVKLAILGDGELREYLQDKATSGGVADRVIFLGERPRHEVPLFLKTGDVFLFPSHFEAFGLALAEAMASGLPVVCSDFEAASEVLGDAGFRIPLSDRAAWIETVNRLMADRSLRTEMAEKAQLKSGKFTFKAMCDGYAGEISAPVAESHA